MSCKNAVKYDFASVSVNIKSKFCIFSLNIQKATLESAAFLILVTMNIVINFPL